MKLPGLANNAAWKKVIAFASADPTGPWKKVEIDLTRIGEDGLRGPPDGKVAVAYEFCIPNTGGHKARVRAIDSSVRFMPGSRGRIGAGKHQCLCIGSTSQKCWEAGRSTC